MKIEYQIMNDLMEQSCFNLDRRKNCRQKDLGKNLSDVKNGNNVELFGAGEIKKEVQKRCMCI